MIKEWIQKDIVIKQLELIKLRNTSKAFQGDISFRDTTKDKINIRWENESDFAELSADLKTHEFSIEHS